MGHLHRKYILCVESGQMTADIWEEFLRTLLFAWMCFGAGSCLWYWRSWANRYGLQTASKGLLLLSPVLLSAFGYRSTEAVRTAELLASTPAARSVFDEAPQLVAEFDCVTTPGGVQIEFSRTRTRTGAEAGRKVQAVSGRGGLNGASDRQSDYDSGSAGASAVEVPEWGSLARYGNGWSK